MGYQSDRPHPSREGSAPMRQDKLTEYTLLCKRLRNYSAGCCGEYVAGSRCPACPYHIMDEAEKAIGDLLKHIPHPSREGSLPMTQNETDAIVWRLGFLSGLAHAKFMADRMRCTRPEPATASEWRDQFHATIELLEKEHAWHEERALMAAQTGPFPPTPAGPMRQKNETRVPTSGPWWSLDEGYPFDGIYRVAGLDNPMGPDVSWEKDNRPIVAECRNPGDARLIGATWELLAALRNIMNGLSSGLVRVETDADETWENAMLQARAAIAKTEDQTRPHPTERSTAE